MPVPRDCKGADIFYAVPAGRRDNRSRSFAITLSKQLWQPRDVDGDPPRLVFRQHLGLQRFGFTSRE
jgi:hypothetical protein